jgi:tRNA threonylcarbamoyladenosine biosynthesis protein TsaE
MSGRASGLAPFLAVSTRSPAETAAVGGALVTVLWAGDVVLLDGDLGAGKTVLTQGLARAAGVEETVTSPTFTLIRSYPTTAGPTLLHADVYRLETRREIEDLGLSDLLDDGAFAVIEWGQRAATVLGRDCLVVVIGRDDARGVEARTIRVHPVGPGWTGRWPAVEAALAGLAPFGPDVAVSDRDGAGSDR